MGVAGIFFEEARSGGIEEVHCKGEVSEKRIDNYIFYLK